MEGDFQKEGSTSAGGDRILKENIRFLQENTKTKREMELQSALTNDFDIQIIKTSVKKKMQINIDK